MGGERRGKPGIGRTGRGEKGRRKRRWKEDVEMMKRKRRRKKGELSVRKEKKWKKRNLKRKGGTNRKPKMKEIEIGTRGKRRKNRDQGRRRLQSPMMMKWSKKRRKQLHRGRSPRREERTVKKKALHRKGGVRNPAGERLREENLLKKKKNRKVKRNKRYTRRKRK